MILYIIILVAIEKTVGGDIYEAGEEIASCIAEAIAEGDGGDVRSEPELA